VTWLRLLAEEITRQGPLVRLTVIRADGSTPREIGATMLVGASGIEDTIGGGALEFEAIAHARRLLASGNGAMWQREWRDFALGPSLGQCCGGAVRLLFERFAEGEGRVLADLAPAADQPGAFLLRPVVSGIPPQVATPGEMAEAWPVSVTRTLRARPAGETIRASLLIPGRKSEPDWWLEPLAAPAIPLILYGAGHVGRALASLLNGLPFRVTWVDTASTRFPLDVPTRIAIQATPDPAGLAETVPRGVFHIVMTYSHPLDLAICHAVLKRDDFGFLGLIGSQTKRARFLKRLREFGVPEERLARLTCPIGLPGIEGKQPAVIAVAIAAQLLERASAG
jgi:xanthine dehydrogenase accessory factor